MNLVRQVLRPYGCAAALVLAALPAVAGERPSLGSPAPLPVVRALAGGDRSLRELSGKRGLVVLFWAGWSDRSVEELRRLNAIAPEMAAHGVAIAAVSVERYDVDDTEMKRLRERVAQLDVQLPVFVDRGLELFNAYSVVTIPSTAVVDASGRLAHFLYGYSHEQREQLFDAIDAVAGIARRPPPSAPLKALPAAIRRVQLGRLQLAQGHEAPAQRSFEEASKADQAFPDPMVELAALALDLRDVAAARDLLDRAARLSASHVGVQRERARLAVVNGDVSSARAALDELTFGADRADSATAAYLGYLLLAAGDQRRAKAAFDRALQISGVDPRTYAPGTELSAAECAKAMTAYRRDVAPGRR